MVMPTVFLTRHRWTRSGHGGRVTETDYAIYLNDVRLRGYSTHGDMSEGYWGSGAKKAAVEYAAKVAGTLGVQVITARLKRDE